MKHFIEHVVSEATGWDSVTQVPHRFGGVELRLDKTEIGHIHRNGMVDILFSVEVRKHLIDEGRASPHHLLPDTGWISFYIREESDVNKALWLLNLSLLQKAYRKARSNPAEQQKIAVQLKEIGASEVIRNAITSQQKMVAA